MGIKSICPQPQQVGLKKARSHSELRKNTGSAGINDATRDGFACLFAKLRTQQCVTVDLGGFRPFSNRAIEGDGELCTRVAIAGKKTSLST
jgi:hypothetical protein